MSNFVLDLKPLQVIAIAAILVSVCSAKWFINDYELMTQAIKELINNSLVFT